MSAKALEEKTHQSYVKCTITDELENSLNTIEKKIGIVRSDIIRAALHEHIKNHYPSYLPKSKQEIENDVKEKFYFEKYTKEFQDLESMKKQIPDLEDYKKTLKNDIITEEKKFNTVLMKLKDNPNKTELRQLENEKNRLESNLKHKRTVEMKNNKQLEEFKQKVSEAEMIKGKRTT